MTVQSTISSGAVSGKGLPSWFRQDLPGEEATQTALLLSEAGVRTVCREARCPNINACFRERCVTFMILGDTCTRNCGFCAVKKADGYAAPLACDDTEPEAVAQAATRLGLRYVVLTSVTRDDLADGGAGVFAKTVQAVKAQNPGAKVEVLLPDFRGDLFGLRTVVAARPDVLGHNIETVKRLYPVLRPEADYEVSLALLARAKELDCRIITKSSLMLGLGEEEEEVVRVMQDLKEASCDILTFGQYLAPSSRHQPVKGFVTPEAFQRYKEIALGLGFKVVYSGPLVRSSFRAAQAYGEFIHA